MSVDISIEAVERACKELDEEAKAEGYGRHLYADILRAQAERIKELEDDVSYFRNFFVETVKKARNDALREAISASKEPIAKIVYDVWYRKDWPVGSHGYQRVQEAVEAAILALIEGDTND